MKKFLLFFSVFVSLFAYGDVPRAQLLWPIVDFGCNVPTANSLGGNANASGATVALTSVNVPARSLIVVGITEIQPSSNGSVADSAGNSYTLIKQAYVNGNSGLGNIQLFYAYNVLPLSGGSITYTKATSGDATSISALFASCIQTTPSPLDAAVTASATASSSTPSVTSGTPGQAGELFVGFLGWNGTGTFTQDSTNAAWASTLTFENSSSASGGGGSVVNSGTGTLKYAPTMGTSHYNAIIIAGFKHH